MPPVAITLCFLPCVGQFAFDINEYFFHHAAPTDVGTDLDRFGS
jgi:hypothetical protein